MSLDRRLRTDLARDAQRIDADTARNLMAVEARARRGSRSSLMPVLVAAVVLVVGIGIRFGAFPSGAGSGGQSSSIEASGTPTCAPGVGGCLGSLAPGTYASRDFRPAVTFTVPAGWQETQDLLWQLDLRYAAGGLYAYPDKTVFHDGISLFRGPIPASSSRVGVILGIGSTAHDLALWLKTHPDLVASDPIPVTIGGLTGYRMSLSLPTGPRTAPDHCTTDHGEPRCESLFAGDSMGGRYGFGLVGPESAIVYLLDPPGDATVMIVIDDVDGMDAAGLVAAATPVVESMTFATGTGASPSP